MYKFSNNIRIRTCEELSFLVNITDNTFFVLKTRTLTFLEELLNNNLNEKNLNISDSSLVDFIHELENQHILEVV